MATSAKYPGALVALADLGGEVADAAAPTELTLDTTIDDNDTSVIVDETIPTEYPASGWIRIDDEVLHYSSFTGSTFTIDVRGDQTEYGAGAAAAHTAGATVGFWVSAQTYNQLMAEVVALEAQLGKKFMTRQAVTVDAADETVDLALGDWVAATLEADWTTPTISNPVTGHVYVFELIQDGTGGWEVTWPAAFTWPGGTPPTLSTDADAVDLVTAAYNGTSYRASAQLDYS